MELKTLVIAVRGYTTADIAKDLAFFSRYFSDGAIPADMPPSVQIATFVGGGPLGGESVNVRIVTSEVGLPVPPDLDPNADIQYPEEEPIQYPVAKPSNE